MADAFASSLGAPLAVFLLSMIPIAEARFAIPFGMSMGLPPIEAFGWAFLGSCMIAPVLLLILIPIINALSKTKFFSKVGKFLYDKFEKKSKQVSDGEQSPTSPDGAAQDGAQSDNKRKVKFTKRDLKRMAGTAGFVAIPLPLTGVWTGSPVASITKIGFLKGLISIIVGNAVACGIITLIGFLFADYVNYITLAFLAIAVLVVVFLIVKFIIYKPDKAAKPIDGTPADADKTSDDNKE